MKKYGLFLLTVLLAGPSARADVKMPAIFGDHMVLQQDLKLPVWGMADPGEEVTVSVGGVQAKTTADASGKWMVKLDPLKVTGDPVEVTVMGKNTLVFKDVLVGDVWVCSGQSNMEFGLSVAHNASTEVPKADHPKLRLFLMAKKIAFDPQDDGYGVWMVCTPENVVKIGGWGGFSAAGYFFGREIMETQKIPVGLIGTYWGGTPAQAWTSLEKLNADPVLKYYADDFGNIKVNLTELRAKYEAEILPKWQKEMDDWKAKPDPKGGKPRKPAPPDSNPHLGTVLFNGMLNPIIPYGIKGVVWYQGEANAGRAEEYATLLPAMIADWRERWGEGNFPFLFVQLAGWKPGGGSWPMLRDSQRKTLSLPNTGMAVAIDIGEETDIHPKDKLDVGHRLALAGRHIAYGEDIVYSGPMLKSFKVEGNKVIVSFDHVGGGLVIGSAPAIRMDQQSQSPASELQAFEIAGADGNFFPAKAVIEGGNVVVSADGVAVPSAVRYAWTSWPEPAANLYNKDGLPAVPFSTTTQ